MVCFQAVSALASRRMISRIGPGAEDRPSTSTRLGWVKTVARGRRQKPSRVMFSSRESFTPRAVGAEMEPSRQSPTRADFRTISKLTRPDRSPRHPARSRPARAAAPMARSRALWRPTSSRTARTWPSAVARQAAWVPPVVAYMGWFSRITANRWWISSISTRLSGPETGFRSRASRSTDSRPQSPQEVAVGAARRALARRARSGGRAMSTQKAGPMPESSPCPGSREITWSGESASPSLRQKPMPSSRASPRLAMSST